MAWNQPGGPNNPWGRRPGQDSGLEQTIKDWQRRLERMLRPGPGGPGGGGDGAAGPAGGRSFFGLIILAAVLLWLATGLYQVQPAEKGVIQRFGKFVGLRDAGLGWHLPWPIETVTKVNVAKVNSSEYKSRVLTADVNLVDMELAVQYQYADPFKVLFSVRDPESTLTEVSESAIRESVGRTNLDGVIGPRRQQVTDTTRELIQRTLDFYDTGIRVTSVNLTNVQVPEPVVPSQRDANKAIADRDRMIKEAEAYQSGIIPVAEGAAARQLEEAEAYRAQVVALARGETTRFGELAAAYNASPSVTRERLYLETIESVLKSSKKVFIDAEGGNNMIYLPLDKLLERQRAHAGSEYETVPQAQSDTGASDVSGGADGRQRGVR